MGDLLGLLPDLLGIGTAVAGGGLFGLLGSIVSSVFKARQVRADREWEEKQWANERELLKLQREIGAAEHDEAIELARETGRWDGLAESQRADAMIGASYRWVNAIKSLFRPFLTAALVVITYLFYQQLLDVLSGAETAGNLALFLSEEQMAALLVYIVYSVVFSASTATVWWFGDRALSPPGAKNK